MGVAELRRLRQLEDENYEHLYRIIEKDERKHLYRGQRRVRLKGSLEFTKQIHLSRYRGEESQQERRNEETREDSDIPGNVPFRHV